VRQALCLNAQIQCPVIQIAMPATRITGGGCAAGDADAEQSFEDCDCADESAMIDPNPQIKSAATAMIGAIAMRVSSFSWVIRACCCWRVCRAGPTGLAVSVPQNSVVWVWAAALSVRFS